MFFFSEIHWDRFGRIVVVILKKHAGETRRKNLEELNGETQVEFEEFHEKFSIDFLQ